MLDKYSTLVYKHVNVMDGKENSSDNFRSNEFKLSKKQRRIVQKELKLRNTLACHENIICCDSATIVCEWYTDTSDPRYFGTSAEVSAPS